MSVTVDATTYMNTLDYGTTSLSFDHTVAADANYLLFSWVAGNADSALTASAGPAFNGTSLGSPIFTSSGSNIRIWEMKAPPSGTSALTMTLSSTNNGRQVFIVRSFKGVDQTTPYGTAAQQDNNTPNPSSVVVSSATDDLVVDFIIAWSVTSITAGGGQTERVNVPTLTAGSPDYLVGSSDKAGASSVTMAWTCTSSGSWIAAAALPLKAGATYSPPVLPFVNILLVP